MCGVCGWVFGCVGACWMGNRVGPLFTTLHDGIHCSIVAVARLGIRLVANVALHGDCFAVVCKQVALELLPHVLVRLDGEQSAAAVLHRRDHARRCTEACAKLEHGSVAKCVPLHEQVGRRLLVAVRQMFPSAVNQLVLAPEVALLGLAASSNCQAFHGVPQHEPTQEPTDRRSR